jgi:hypothetical protein
VSDESSTEAPAKIADDFAGRRHILGELSEELVGPSPKGPEIDLVELANGRFPDEFVSDGPYVQKESKEEILCVEPPGLRYGIGVLYPSSAVNELDGKDELPSDPALETIQASLGSSEDPSPAPQRSAEDSIKRIVDRGATGKGEPETDDFDLSGTNVRRPNSMALSFVVRPPAGSRLVVRANGGRYEPVEFSFEKSDRRIERIWWKRCPVTITARFLSSQLLGAGKVRVSQPETLEVVGEGPLDLRIELYSRPTDLPNQRLITVCLINRTEKGQGNNERSLFQTAFRVDFEDCGEPSCILPYPKVNRVNPDEEEQSLDLLYREFETFAIGHGCGADWERNNDERTATCVRAVALPAFETPSITPEIRRADGSAVEVPMANLAGLVRGNDGNASLSEIVELYRNWIKLREDDLERLDNRYVAAARGHLEQCKRCVSRIREGLDFLREDPLAAKAFRLANESILIQQLRASRTTRGVQLNEARLVFDRPAPEIDMIRGAPGRGNWRPFQIAFLLMSIRSTVKYDDNDRETVDLIWFPTGGGKTEAYFGLAAFSAFYRRLLDPTDIGVQVLMRYTLRLLTAQQFQRASGLICAMEKIRRREERDLGVEPFSIGIWLGGDTTPNHRSDARSILRDLQREEKYVNNKLLVTKCPWCSALLGPIELRLGGCPGSLATITRAKRLNLDALTESANSRKASRFM